MTHSKETKEKQKAILKRKSRAGKPKKDHAEVERRKRKGPMTERYDAASSPHSTKEK